MNKKFGLGITDCVRLSCISLIFVLLPVIAISQETPKHFGWHSSDAFVQCATTLLGKRAYISVNALDAIDEREGTFQCPADKKQLLDAMSFLAPVEEEHFAYFSTRDEVDHYLNVMLQSIHAEHAEWELDQAVSLRATPPNSKQLDDSLVKAIAATVREQGRPVPSSWRTKRGRKTFTVDERLFVDATDLGLGRSSVIVVAPGTGFSRIYFGELEDRKFHLLWDSPLIQGDFVALDYRDLNSDSIPEILIKNSQVQGNTAPALALTIFDVNGDVLTPKSDDYYCLPSPDSCAIIGDDFVFVRGAGNKLDIIARFESRLTRRYRLVNSTYRRVIERKRNH